MGNQIKLKCAKKDCEGFVYYQPSDPGIVLNFKVETSKIKKSFLNTEQHEAFVKNVIADEKFKANSTVLIYLTCTGDPSHTLAYEIPA
jgi:hypothetical protein